MFCKTHTALQPHAEHNKDMEIERFDSGFSAITPSTTTGCNKWNVRNEFVPRSATLSLRLTAQGVEKIKAGVKNESSCRGPVYLEWLRSR